MKKGVSMSSDLPSELSKDKKNTSPPQPVAESEFANSELSCPVPHNKVLQIVNTDVPLPKKTKGSKIRPVHRVTGEFLVTNLDATKGKAAVLFTFTKFV
jgi:hypothetical protein